MNFNKEAHIARMKPCVDKLLTHLKNKGISFSPSDEEGSENVTFTSKEKTIKMSKHSFYRFSGICCVTKDGNGVNTIEYIEVTDEMYMNTFMKPIVEALFKIK